MVMLCKGHVDQAPCLPKRILHEKERPEVGQAKGVIGESALAAFRRERDAAQLSARQGSTITSQPQLPIARSVQDALH